MTRGLCGLATVAAMAPFLGMVGTLWAIVNSFPGFDGERSAIMAAIAERLSQSIMPTALRLAVAPTALCGYRTLKNQMADFDGEMRRAELDLAHYLAGYSRP
jgi:biopolymer transport protein TolQ